MQELFLVLFLVGILSIEPLFFLFILRKNNITKKIYSNAIALGSASFLSRLIFGGVLSGITGSEMSGSLISVLTTFILMFSISALINGIFLSNITLMKLKNAFFISLASGISSYVILWFLLSIFIPLAGFTG